MCFFFGILVRAWSILLNLDNVFNIILYLFHCYFKTKEQVKKIMIITWWLWKIILRNRARRCKKYNLFQESNPLRTPESVYHSTKTALQRRTYFALKLCVLLHYYCYPFRIASAPGKQGGDGDHLWELCPDPFFQKTFIGHFYCDFGMFRALHLSLEKFVGLRKLRFPY